MRENGFLGQVPLAGLGQSDECAKYKQYMDQAAAQVAALQQQIQSAAAAGNSTLVSQLSKQQGAAVRRWEHEKSWYDACMKYGFLTVESPGFTFMPPPPPPPPRPPSTVTLPPQAPMPAPR